MLAPLRRRRRLLLPVERIHDEHGVAVLGETLAHLPKRGPQPEDVRPDEHGRVRAGRRGYEVRVALAIGRLDRDVALLDVDGVRSARQHQRNADGGGERADVPAASISSDPQRNGLGRTWCDSLGLLLERRSFGRLALNIPVRLCAPKRDRSAAHRKTRIRLGPRLEDRPAALSFGVAHPRRRRVARCRGSRLASSRPRGLANLRHELVEPL